MFKKFLVSALALAASITMAASVNAADVYQTIQVTEGQYPNIDFYPRTLHVNQGDTLHLTIKNTRQGFTRIFMPAFNLDQDIPPGNVAQLEMCVANPTGKDMWFQISSISAENVPGTIVTDNFQVPIVQAPTRTADLSVLTPIINYSNEFCYSEKPEPRYRAPSRAVRGYW